MKTMKVPPVVTIAVTTSRPGAAPIAATATMRTAAALR
jgi:hypothetical protein